MEIDGPENDKARARNLNTTDATGRSDDALMSNEVEESERNASLNLVGHGQENGEGDEGNDRNVPEQTYWETEKKLMIPVHHLASPGDSPACSVRARGHPSPERQKDWAGSPCFGATSTSPSSGGRWNVVTPKSNSHPAGTRIRMVQHLGESGGYDELVVDFDDDLHRGIPPRGINRLRVDLIYVIPGNPGLTYAYENFAVSLATTFRTPAVVVSHLGHCSRYVGGCTALKDQVAHHARVLQQKVMKLQRGRRILVLAHSIGGYIVQEMTTWDPSLERSIIVGLLCPTLTQ
eukprot:GHVU01233173.1.p1 GENE.GHVU01233173.1~~GHVU01233173.1.p1  ORF type:complete len:291 (+),score=34.11 GHVU01233173.1:274-1146(+)